MSSAKFEIDIIQALTTQLVDALDKLTESPLTQSAIKRLSSGQGVYQLLLNKRPVYVGKSEDIPYRLAEHKFKLEGRNSSKAIKISFKCLYVHKNWTTLAPEASLITHYKKEKLGECAWNGNGFGPHDPGRNREITNKPPDGFDAIYPIKHDWPCHWITPRTWNVLSLLLALKNPKNLPFLFRYETEHLGGDKFAHHTKGHPDHRGITVEVPKPNMSVVEILTLITKALPGWQATRFVSHVILYKEHRYYRHGTIIHFEPSLT